MTNPLALNTITIKQVTSLPEQIRLAAQAGYQGIGLWFDRLDAYLESGGSLSELARMLADEALSVPEICYVGGWMGEPEAARQVALDAATKRFEMAAALQAETVIACAAFGKVDIPLAAAEYAELCERAAPFNVVPALEFIGPAATVKDVKTAADIVRRAGHELGGVLLDTFHFYRGGSEPGDLSHLGGAPVAMCHVNDATGKPRFELTDLERVFCGAGEIPLAKIFRGLKKLGYKGAYSVEIFNEGYWSRDALEIAREGRDTLAQVLESV